MLDVLWEAEVRRRLGVGLSSTQLDSMFDAQLKRAADAMIDKTVHGKWLKIKEKYRRLERGQQRVKKSEELGFSHLSYGATAKAAPVTYSTLMTDFVMMIVDVETPGFGMYNDTLMEMAALVHKAAHVQEVSIHIADEDPVTWRGLSKVQALKPGVAGHAHIDLDSVEMVTAGTEGDLLESFMDFCERINDRAAPLPVVLFAHNGHAFDLSIILQALRRAAIPFDTFITRTRIAGIVDTLKVARTVDWSVQAQASSLLAGADITAVGDVPAAELPAVAARQVLSVHRALADAKREARRQKTAASDGPAGAGGPGGSSEPAGGSGGGTVADSEGPTADTAVESEDDEAMDEVVQLDAFDAAWFAEGPDDVQDRQQHGLQALHAMLVGEEAEGAHQAASDVHALARVMVDPRFERQLCEQRCLWLIESARLHLDRLYASHVQKHLGWEPHMMDWPSCAHGKLVGTVAPDSADVEDAPHLKLRCRMLPGMGCTTTATLPPTETWVPPTKKRPRCPKEKLPSVLGNCQCTSACVTARCPCRAAQQLCTTQCGHTHGASGQKCKNWQESGMDKK
jgi:hypothetical protein